MLSENPISMRLVPIFFDQMIDEMNHEKNYRCSKDLKPGNRERVIETLLLVSDSAKDELIVKR